MKIVIVQVYRYLFKLYSKIQKSIPKHAPPSHEQHNKIIKTFSRVNLKSLITKFSN